MSEPTNQANMKPLFTGANQMGIALSPAQIDQFRRYQELLLEWNQRINLTAVREPEQIQERHFLDALSCSLITGDLNNHSLIDIGSGAGFPGLPLKILFPDLRLTLVESVGKKAAFLETAMHELNLAHVQIITARAEELGQNEAHRQQYEWAVARAVARLNVLIEYLLPLVRIGGHILAQKGQQAGQEIGEAETGIALLGGGLPELRSVQIPNQAQSSSLIIIEKIAATPAKYPRRAGIPAKRPL